MSVRRLIERGQDRPEGATAPEHVPLAEWLDYLDHRRAVILMELRQIEPVLVRYGRLQNETPRRTR